MKQLTISLCCILTLFFCATCAWAQTDIGPEEADKLSTDCATCYVFFRIVAESSKRDNKLEEQKEFETFSNVMLLMAFKTAKIKHGDDANLIILEKLKKEVKVQKEFIGNDLGNLNKLLEKYSPFCVKLMKEMKEKKLF